MSKIFSLDSSGHNIKIIDYGQKEIVQDCG